MLDNLSYRQALSISRLLQNDNEELYNLYKSHLVRMRKDVDNIPSLLSSMQTMFTFDQDKFILAIIRMYSPESLISNVVLANGVRKGLINGLHIKTSRKMTYYLERAYLRYKKKDVKEDIEAMVKIIGDGKE